MPTFTWNGASASFATGSFWNIKDAVTGGARRLAFDVVASGAYWADAPAAALTG